MPLFNNKDRKEHNKRERFRQFKKELGKCILLCVWQEKWGATLRNKHETEALKSSGHLDCHRTRREIHGSYGYDTDYCL